MSMFSSPPYTGTEAYILAPFLGIIIHASKNVQAIIKPFLWFCVKLILLKPDPVLTVL